MSTASTTHRLRTGLALCAGAALLGLSACGPQDDTADAEMVDATIAASDGGDQGASDGGEQGAGDEDADDDGIGTQEGGDGAAGGRTSLLLVTELGLDDTVGDGPLTLEPEQLAALLAEPFAGSAECSDSLELEPGTSAACRGPANMDSPEPTQEWLASTVFVPTEEGFEDGAQVAVLFTTGTEFPEGASELLDEEVSLTGVGFGSMFGAEGLTAAELGESTLQVLTSENAYVPVHDAADWSSVTCADGMSFETFETVDCTAATTDGSTWELEVAPGTFAENDQGLLVGIETGRGA